MIATRGLINLLKGQIFFESDPQMGDTVTFTVPFKKCEDKGDEQNMFGSLDVVDLASVFDTGKSFNLYTLKGEIQRGNLNITTVEVLDLEDESEQTDT